jgi:hypothetical protein
MKRLAALGAWSARAAATLLGEHPRETRFTLLVPDPAALAAVELVKPPHLNDWRLNGRAVPLPFPETWYERIPGIPVSMLRRGRNELVLRHPARLRINPHDMLEDRRASLPVEGPLGEIPLRVVAVPRETPPAFAMGPVLGRLSETGLAVHCHTDRIARVTIEAEGRVEESPPGRMHRFRLEGFAPGETLRYSLRAEDPETGAAAASGPHLAQTLDPHHELLFAVCGDNRENREVWARVAGAILRARPAFVCHTGDMSKHGHRYEPWRRDFVAPAAALVSATPLYAVLGNHDHDAALFRAFFPQPPGGPLWEARLGPVHLVGVDGRADWRAGGGLAARLGTLLRGSDAPFLFLLNHYPAFSSTHHGRPRLGRPRRRVMRQARDVLLPLATEAGVTATLSAHDHCYERSELPGGVTQLITAGAGAPFYPRLATADRQNPHSVVFTNERHYLLVRATSARCRMQAVDLDGRILDERDWTPRPARS